MDMVLDLMRARMGHLLSTRNKLIRQVRGLVIDRTEAFKAVSENMDSIRGDPGLEVLQTVVESLSQLFHFEHTEEKDVVLLEDRDIEDIKRIEGQFSKLRNMDISVQSKNRIDVLYNDVVTLHKKISTDIITHRKRVRDMLRDRERLSVQMAQFLTNDRREVRAARRTSREEVDDVANIERILGQMSHMEKDPVKLEKSLDLLEKLIKAFSDHMNETFGHFFKLTASIVSEHHEALEMLSAVQQKVATLNQDAEPIKKMAKDILEIYSEDRDSQKSVARQLRDAA